jgi:putative ABC transport system permease protein
MTWLALAFKEWRRRPVRTVVTAAGVGIAVAGLFSLLAFQRGYRAGVQSELDRLGAHVLVVPKGCPYDAASLALHGASWPCYLKARYLDEVKATPGVAWAAPVLMAAFYEPNGKQAVYLGVDTNMLALRPGWQIKGAFPRQGGQLLVGSDLARQRQWRLGQTVVLPGLHAQTGFVQGILSSTGGAEDTFIFLPLLEAQRLLGRSGELTHILVRLKNPDRLEEVVAQLRGCDAGLYMNVVPLGHLFQTIQNVLRSTRLLLGAIALVGLLAAAAGVSNTVLMSVAERTREIGVLRALGASRVQIFGLFWAETMQVCCVGTILGVAGAFLSSRLLEAWLRSAVPFAPAQSLIHWETAPVLACLGCALGLGSIAGFLPAWRAADLAPMEAMRATGGTR